MEPSRKKSGTKKDGKKKFDFDINTETGEPNLHNRNFKILKKESGLSKSVYDMTEDEFQHWIDTADRIGMGRAARISAKSDRHNVPKRKQGWFDRILETDAPSEPRSPSEPTTTPGIAQGSESKEGDWDFTKTFPQPRQAVIEQLVPGDHYADPEDIEQVRAAHDEGAKEIVGWKSNAEGAAEVLKELKRTGKNPETGHKLSEKGLKQRINALEKEIEESKEMANGLLDYYENIYGQEARQAFEKWIEENTEQTDEDPRHVALKKAGVKKGDRVVGEDFGAFIVKGALKDGTIVLWDEGEEANIARSHLTYLSPEDVKRMKKTGKYYLDLEESETDETSKTSDRNDVKEKRYYTSVPDEWRAENDLYDWGGKKGLRSRGNRKIGKRKSFAWTNEFERMPVRLKGMKKILDAIRSRTEEVFKVHTRKGEDCYLVPPQVLKEVKAKLGDKAFEQKPKPKRSPKQLINDAINAMKRRKHDDTEIGAFIEGYAEELGLTEADYTDNIKGYIEVFHNDPEAEKLRASFQSGMVQEVPTPETEEELTAEREAIQSKAEAEAEELGDFLEGLGEQEEGSKLGGSRQDYYADRIMQAFGDGVTSEQAYAIVSIWQANADVQGLTLDEWFDKHIADIIWSVEEELTGKQLYSRAKTRKLSQRNKAAVEFLEDGRAIIHALEGADISSLVHETAHIFRRTLSGNDLRIAEQWAGAKDGKWNVDAEEKFARGFERYLRDGSAPTTKLKSIFQKFKQWLTAIYQSIIGGPLDIKITPEMQNVFDRLLTTDIIERENYGKAKETARTGREPADTEPTRRSGPGGEQAGTEGTRSNNIESGETPSLEQLEVAQSKQPIIQSAELIPETSDYDFSDFGIDTEELNQAVSDAEKEALEKLVGPVRDKDLLGREELEGGTSGKQTEFFDREDFLTLEERSRINARDDVEGQDLLFQAAEPLDGNQKKGISLALDSLKRGESFLLADGTGFGKTRQIIAIAAMKQKQSGKPSLIVTQSKQIINGNFRPQAQAINVDLSTIEIGTYDGLRSGKIGKKEYGVALFDEAHNLKNLHAGKTIAANKVKTDGKVFATATPMDSPTAASYFLSEISGISQEEVRRRLGYHIETKYNQRGEPYQIAVLNEDNTWITVIDHIVDMRNEAVGRGNMIRREIPFNGTMEDKTVQLASDFRQQQNDIYAYWQKRIKRARSKRAKMNLGGQRTGELSRYTEAMKIAPVFEAAIEDLQAGRKIIIVAEGVKSTEIKALQETVPGFLGDFAKGLEKMGYDYAKIYGPGNKSAEVARFQNDEVQIALMTPKSGGAGIDLDDSIGNNPRTMYIVTTNYSGDIFDQILGRVSRRNTKSPARLVFVKADAISDKKRSNIIDRKVRTLQAIQRGEDLDRAYGFEITDDEGNSQILYQAETEKQTPLDVQNFLRRKKNLAPLRITKDKIDTEALIDGYFAERDEKVTEAYVDAMNYQIQIKVALGDKEHSGWRKRHIEADTVIQVYIDLKNNPGQLDKYYDKLTKQQKHIVNQAQNLSGKLKKIADAIIAQNKKHGMEAYRSGVINNVLENYSMRLWVSDTKRNWPNRKFGTQTARAKHRTLEGILHGWSLGKELQIKGATNAQQVMRKQISDTIADRKLVKTGKMYGLISDQKFDDWVRVEHPNFTNWRWAGKAEKAKTYGKNFFVTSANNLMERVPMYAEPDLGKHLNNVLGTSALYKIPGIRWITEWNARLKRWILFTSFFHHQAYLRSYDLGGQTGLANMSPKKAYEAGRTAIENFTPDLRRGVRNGLTIGKIQDYDENALRGKHTLIGRIIRKAKPVDTVVQQAEKLRDWNEHILFSKLGPYLKVQAYLLEYKSLVNKHEKQIKNGTKTLDDLAKIAANLVNDDFGGLHLGRKGRNPTTQHLFRLLALAPDWTESNVASAIKAFKLGAEGSVYRAFWARIAAKGLLAIVVFNYLMAMYDEDDETEETTLDRFVQRYKEAWKSGKMRWLDVDITPIYKMLGGKSDKRKYFSLLGHFKDPIKFIARKTIKDSKSKSTNIPDPLRSLIISTKYKGSVVTRIFADGITGKNWAGREFTTLAELLGVDDKGKYVTTRRGHYRKGDPKGGKLKGELTKWSMGGIKPLGLNQVPSFLIYETENNMPIQVQQGINYLGGQVDAFDAILKSLGVYVHSSYPEKKGKSK